MRFDARPVPTTLAPSSPRTDRDFGWLWAAFAVSTFGTFLAFDAFPLIAILALDAGPAAVSLLASAGLLAGALVALPLGPWVELRRKRPVMVGADLVRFGALASVPVAYGLDALTLGQLVVVTIVVAAADIAFRAANGAFLKAFLDEDGLLVANSRFEQTTWTATAVGPPAGGAAITVLGPVVTVVANAVSFLASALLVRRIRAVEDPPRPLADSRPRLREVGAGWRAIWGSPALRPLFLNSVLVNALILAPAPLLAVLMLDDLGFAAWQYALAFGLPCVGGLVGARLSPRLVAARSRAWVLRTFGTARAVWPIGLAFVVAGPAGLALVMVLQLALLVCIGIFNPVSATERLRRTDTGHVARVLAAWTVTGNLVVAALTAAWGGLATVIGLRPAIFAAGALLLLTPLLLPRARALRP